MMGEMRVLLSDRGDEGDWWYDVGPTVAELWAAIMKHEVNCYNAGAVSEAGSGSDEGEAGAMDGSRDDIRELLGMEGSHDSGASEAGQPGGKSDPR